LIEIYFSHRTRNPEKFQSKQLQFEWTRLGIMRRFGPSNGPDLKVRDYPEPSSDKLQLGEASSRSQGRVA
jgi:hypothetical protein